MPQSCRRAGSRVTDRADVCMYQPFCGNKMTGDLGCSIVLLLGGRPSDIVDRICNPLCSLRRGRRSSGFASHHSVQYKVMGIVCESRINALTYPLWGLCVAVLNLQFCIFVYAGPVSSVSNENFACESRFLWGQTMVATLHALDRTALKRGNITIAKSAAHLERGRPPSSCDVDQRYNWIQPTFERRRHARSDRRRHAHSSSRSLQRERRESTLSPPE